MITPARLELLELMKELSIYCDWRPGQMIANLVGDGRGDLPEDIWEAEDEELLPVARKLVEYFRATRPEQLAEYQAATSAE